MTDPVFKAPIRKFKFEGRADGHAEVATAQTRKSGRGPDYLAYNYYLP